MIDFYLDNKLFDTRSYGVDVFYLLQWIKGDDKYIKIDGQRIFNEGQLLTFVVTKGLDAPLREETC